MFLYFHFCFNYIYTIFPLLIPPTPKGKNTKYTTDLSSFNLENEYTSTHTSQQQTQHIHLPTPSESTFLCYFCPWSWWWRWWWWYCMALYLLSVHVSDSILILTCMCLFLIITKMDLMLQLVRNNILCISSRFRATKNNKRTVFLSSMNRTTSGKEGQSECCRSMQNIRDFLCWECEKVQD